MRIACMYNKINTKIIMAVILGVKEDETKKKNMRGRGSRMTSKKDLKLIHTMMKKKSMTSKEIEKIFAVSNKTARKMIALLNDEIKKHGAEFESKPGKGYSLVVYEPDTFDKFLENNQCVNTADIQNRPEFLIQIFIDTEDYLKLDDLADMLYVSPQIVSKALKKAEEYMEAFDLSIERRPHYGMRLAGREYDIRRCLSTLSGENEYIIISDVLRNIVKQIFQKYDIKMSEMALTSFLMSVQIMIDRVQRQKFVELDLEKLGAGARALLDEKLPLARECLGRLEMEYKFVFPESEVYYVALNVADKKYYEDSGNLLIDKEINAVVTDILENIYETYRLDFRKDLDFYMMLVKHLIPLRVRLNYGTMLKNPILQEVKNEYPFALSIASGLNHIMKKYYDKQLSEDELSYIAIAIQLAIEKQTKNNQNKKNILLVCASGNVFSRFFKYRFQEMFKDCIDQAFTCDYPDLADYDFRSIDYVFSTVPIDLVLPVPTFQVDYFPDESEVGDIRTVLQKPENVIEKYFSEDLFLTGLQADSKEEVIRKMCDHISIVRDVPDNFHNLVALRESLAQTAMGDLVAVPHPYRTVTESTLICVAVLKKSILWNQIDKVRVVFLISISQNDLDDIENFYAEFFKVALSKENIDSIIKDQTYENLMRIVRRS